MLLPHRGLKEGGKEGKGGRIWSPESPVTLKFIKMNAKITKVFEEASIAATVYQNVE